MYRQLSLQPASLRRTLTRRRMGEGGAEHGKQVWRGEESLILDLRPVRMVDKSEFQNISVQSIGSWHFNLIEAEKRGRAAGCRLLQRLDL